MIDDIAKRIAFFSTVLLVLSVTYDYTYLLALGLSFADVPTVIGDHVRSAIIWSPSLVVGSLIGLIAGLATPPDSAGTTRRHPNHQAVDLLIFAGAMPMLAILALISPLTQALLMLAAILSAVAFRFQPGKSNIELRLGAGSARLVYVVPAALALVGNFGWNHGIMLRAAGAPTAILTLKPESTPRTLVATGLRRFSAAAIVVDATGKLHVVPADAILKVVHSTKVQPPISCLLLNRLCNPSK